MGADLVRRIRGDFKLQILTIFLACVVTAIVPFAAYRFATGNLVAGLVDVAMVLLFIGAVGYAVATGRSHGVSLFCVVVYTVGIAAITRLGGLPGLLWIYPSLVCNYLLVSRRHALLASAVGLGLLLANHQVVPDTLLLGSSVATALIVVLFSYIFARVTDQQRERLEVAARLDPLTGAPNRRALDADVQGLMAQAAAPPMGLMLLDLDHFKHINDRHGHDEGDQVLVAFAALLRSNLRHPDRSYRLGGEEFVVLLPQATAHTLHQVAERLRQRTQREIGTASGGVTVSIGAAMRRPAEPFDAWVKRADKALYQAKHAGRNRLVIAGEETPSAVAADALGEVAQ
jgi:diguanylate cyclase (GGDEF)-like protein